ncbi:MAG TPA: hypothetical protein PK706_00665 [Xanthobacteraceae bacterium]|jgi:hypothetical protein|nr:hypothetical protein [Xanthobacteraceae bacterium]
MSSRLRQVGAGMASWIAAVVLFGNEVCVIGHLLTGVAWQTAAIAALYSVPAYVLVCVLAG